MKWPVLYQAHPRRIQQELRELGLPSTSLAETPECWFSNLAGQGFDWIYILGVWQTGPRSRQVSLTNPCIAGAHASHLPDWSAGDVCGSPFAIQSWIPHSDFGGLDGLASFRDSARRHGMKLMLDFVPNHVGLDNPWAVTNPGWFFCAPPECSLGLGTTAISGGPCLMHGKDPYFPPWPDTFQLNLFHPEVREAHRRVLAAVASQCDGLRCDMAMLPLTDVFQSTWGGKATDIPGFAADTTNYWPGVIKAARDVDPRFLFLAECYWDREWDLMCQGFDYCYDKRLYERLAHGSAEEVVGHLRAAPAFRDKCAHFLENHDEPRIPAVFGERRHAAAVVNYLAPGLRFVHQGQELGLRIRDSVHLSRNAHEPIDDSDRIFYQRLMQLSSSASSLSWRLLQPEQAWSGNPTHSNFIAMAIGEDPCPDLVIVNYSPTHGQCRLKWDWNAKPTGLVDLLSSCRFDTQPVEEIIRSGLYIDLPPWGYHFISAKKGPLKNLVA